MGIIVCLLLQPVLEGELGKWGNLTEILASTLIELQSPKCDVFNPTRLLNKLIQRCPQFGGGEQHDSHELLRHLLEGVRTEDLKVHTDIVFVNLTLLYQVKKFAKSYTDGMYLLLMTYNRKQI